MRVEWQRDCLESHITCYHQQENQGLLMVIKLKEEHVSLNPYSAAQVLGDAVARYSYTYQFDE